MTASVAQAEELVRHEQVAQVRAAVVTTGLARALRIERPGIVGVACVFYHQVTRRGEDLPGPRRPRGQNTIEKIDPTRDRVQKIFGISHSHQVPRAFGRQHRLRHRHPVVQGLGRLTDRQPADGVTIETDVH